MTGDQLAAQKAITAAMVAADQHRSDRRSHAKCIEYASRVIESLRATIDTVDPRIDRAWRD